MKAEFEIDSDCLANKIAQEVVKAIKPFLAPGAPEDEGLFTVKTLAEYLGTSTKWVYERVQLKEIPYIKVGKHIRFRKSEIDRWLDALKVPAMDSPSRMVRLAPKAKTSKATA